MADIKITDSSGNTSAQFVGNDEESIATQGHDHGAAIPLSCGVGACRTCVATVETGMEHLDTEAVGPAQVPLEENEVLTCICALKKDAPSNAKVSMCCQNL